MDNQDKYISALGLMAKRLRLRGGSPQQDRMIKDKRWSLDHAVLYSYQAAKIKRLNQTDEKAFIRALINPNKLKQDYDDKIVSVGFEHGFKPGDIFEWCNTGTKWLIYLQDLTELAYFRGDIRKCSYQVSWINSDNEVETTYLAVRGPVETKINYVQKSGDSIDRPNYSLNILMPKTKSTLEYFRRYAKFYLKGIEDGDVNTCWRVEATDTISMPGVLQISAVEYYANEIEDDMENGVVDGLIVKPVDQPTSTDLILGQGFIKPKIKATYTYEGLDVPHWSIDEKYPVAYKVNGRSIELVWLKSYSGQFELNCNDSTKTIVVESLY